MQGVESTSTPSRSNKIARQVEVSERAVGEDLTVRARISLGNLKPEDIRVQVYYGRLDTKSMIQDGDAVDMPVIGRQDDGTYEFAVTVRYETSGERGLSVRVLPSFPHLDSLLQASLVRWAAE